MKIPRFAEPDAKVEKCDHEEELFYCQHCESYFIEDEMKDVEYEICEECFEKAVNHWSRWPKIQLSLLTITKELIDGVDDKLSTIRTIEKLNAYLKGL